ncbi:MAG: hypothetical protein JWP03_3796 [Phycisphaerales bacterium]|nr:hypothetical protein [Phycisphaerales bacterium]
MRKSGGVALFRFPLCAQWKPGEGNVFRAIGFESALHQNEFGRGEYWPR